MPVPDDLPPWATGNYGAGSDSWSATARRVVTGIVGFAAAGLTPNAKTDAQSFNEWLGRAQEWVEWFRTERGVGHFGDGSDGNVTIAAGTTTLSRDMYYADLTVPNAAVLETAGFRVFVSGTLTVRGTGRIRHNGADASGGTAGSAAVSGSLGGGGSGATGVSNAAGQAGAAGSTVTTSLGGDGGDGGTAGGPGTGGAGGTSTDPAAILGGWRHLLAARGRADGGAGTQWTGGAGGGSGGTEDGTGTSGGGGGGGGVMSIWARVLDNGGTIQATGGDGGNAAVGTSTTIGGGGGGGGGVIFLVYREAVGGTIGTVSAAGGAGGSGHALATDGADGADGLVLSFVV